MKYIYALKGDGMVWLLPGQRIEVDELKGEEPESYLFRYLARNPQDHERVEEIQREVVAEVMARKLEGK